MFDIMDATINIPRVINTVESCTPLVQLALRHLREGRFVLHDSEFQLDEIHGSFSKICERTYFGN